MKVSGWQRFVVAPLPRARVSAKEFAARLSQPPAHRLLLIAGSLLLAVGAFFLTDAILRHADAEAGRYMTIPANDPARGLVYAGLQGGGNGNCVGVTSSPPWGISPPDIGS